MNPLVSVVIPTFRRPELLALAVASVANQSYRPIELIVVDDDSDGRTPQVIHSTIDFRKTDLQVVTLGRTRGGAPAARNAGLFAARGRYVQFLDDDDELFPEKFSRQVPVLEQDRGDVVYGDWRQGQDLTSSTLQRRRRATSQFAYLAGVTWLPPFSYLARTDLCRGIGGWDPDLTVNQDLDFYLRLAASGARFVHVPGDVGFFRWHPGPRVSRQGVETRSDVAAAIIRRATDRLQERRALTPEETDALTRRYYRLALEALPDRRLFAKRHAELERWRRAAGRRPALVERLLPPRAAFHVLNAARPLHWGRRLVHAALSHDARHRIRRWQRRLAPHA